MKAKKKLVMQILNKEFMSSESSGEEELEDGTKRSVLSVKRIPRRSPKANRILNRLDEKAKKNMSKQSLQQTRTRVIGPVSDRSKPVTLSDDF